MHARIHKIEKRLNMTVPLKKWNKEEDGNRVHFYLQVNPVRPRARRQREDAPAVRQYLLIVKIRIKIPVFF